MINEKNTRSLIDYRTDTKLELRKRKLESFIHEKRLNILQSKTKIDDDIENQINYENEDIVKCKDNLISTELILDFIEYSDSKSNIEALIYGLFRLKLSFSEIGPESTKLIENLFNKVYSLVDLLEKHKNNSLIVQEITRVLIFVFYYIKSDSLTEILFSQKLIDAFTEILFDSSKSDTIKSNILIICGNCLCSSSIRKRFLVSKIMDFIINFLNLQNTYLDELILQNILWCLMRILLIKPSINSSNVSNYTYNIIDYCIT